MVDNGLYEFFLGMILLIFLCFLVAGFVTLLDYLKKREHYHNCGTGVAFTRNPATGEKGLMGEFLTNAQGEDVVAGVRTPMPIS